MRRSVRSEFLVLICSILLGGCEFPRQDHDEDDEDDQADQSGGSRATGGRGGAPTVGGSGGTGDSGASSGTSAGGAPTSWEAVTIDFDSLPPETVVTTQFPGVQFSSEPGQVNVVLDYGTYCGTSSPNALCAGAAHACGRSKILAFPSPVRGVRMLLGCTDVAAKVADVRVFQGETVTTRTVNGHTAQTTPIELDLSSFAGVTRIEIVETGADAQGFTLDDIRFERPL